MRTHFYRSQLTSIITLTLLLALPLLGCREDVTSSRTSPADAQAAALNETAEPASSFSWVGTQHNAALDHLLLELGRIRGLERMPDPAIAGLVENGTRRFLMSQGIDAGSEMVRRGIASVPRDNLSFRRARDLANAGELSWYAVQYLEQIQVWVDDGAIPITDLRTRLRALDLEAYENLDPTEAELVLSVSAVAASSTAYWEENGDEWAEWYTEKRLAEPLSARPGRLPRGGEDVSVMGRINWRRVAGHDVIGAISGGTAAAVTGAGIAAGAAGGAAGASTLSALGQLVLGW